MALAYINIEIELREISLKDRPEELYKASSKGTVPVLITLDNLIIDESLEIMLWALKNKSNQTWLTSNSSKELEMISENDTLFKKWLDRYKYHDRYPENSKKFYRDNCSKILDNYETQLNKTKYLLSNDLNIVDIAIFPFIRQFANVDSEWFQNNYKNLANWLDGIFTLDLFIAVMQKYNLWDSRSGDLIINY